ncbi:hypothetical protein PROPEN_02095 [Proteus penneri ATCC 35198]|nr:hypothetical protein PROPEN_02095 [Proteus penneri ATCC 35198]
MKQHTTLVRKGDSTLVPVAGLTVFAIASGYLMSLIPLSMSSFGMDTLYASWLASIYFIGLLIGSVMIEPIIARIGHRLSFVVFFIITGSDCRCVAFHALFISMDNFPFYWWYGGRRDICCCRVMAINWR